MSLNNQLLQDMKQAMRDKDSLKLGVIRLLRSKIKNAEIEQGELVDDQIENLVAQSVKQWQDATSDYQKGGRDDLVKETKQKISILKEYLPQQIDDEQLLDIIDQVCQDTGLDQVGPIIGKVKQKVGNQASGARVAQLVKQKLSS